MAGCIQLFPKSPLAYECQKAIDAAKKSKHDGGYLSKSNIKMLAAIDTFRSGRITIQELENIASQVKAEKLAWMVKKGYRR